MVAYAKGFDVFHDMFRGKNTVNCQADVIASYVRDSEAFVSEVKNTDWYKNMSCKLKQPKRPLSEQVSVAEGKRESQANTQLSMHGLAEKSRTGNIPGGR